MSLPSQLLRALGYLSLLFAALVFNNEAYAQVSLNLSPGWNLLGNSSSQPINAASTFNDTTKFTTVWTWNKTAGKWAFYTPSLSSTDLAAYATNKGYDVLNTINSKEGFWVNAAKATSFYGPVASGVTLVASDLVQGWNLMGSADATTPALLNQGLNTSLTAAGKSILTVWAWDTSGAWRFYTPSMDATSLANYITSKGYLGFTTALSNSDGFWMNIGASSSGSSTTTSTSSTSTTTTAPTTSTSTTTTGVATTTTAPTTSTSTTTTAPTTSPSSTTTVVATTTTTTNPPAFVQVPVVNTPVDGATVTLTCSDGSQGGTGKATQGTATIAVDPVNCVPPYTMEVSGTGTMAGPDLKFGTADDETYESTARGALKSVIQASDLGLTSSSNLSAGSTTAAPAITSLTTMVAFALPPNPGVTDFSNAIAKVQSVAGLNSASQVYANPLTDGAVFNAATLVNEMVANAVKADPTQVPSTLFQNMANAQNAKLTDTTIDPASLMGASSAASTVLKAQMATMQAKAEAMKSVADAVKAAAGSGTAMLMPADALTYLNTALAGSNAAAAQQAVAQAQLAQDTMKQMATQMTTMQADTSINGDPAALATRMAAMMQGLDSVRATQDTSLQSAITNAGTNASASAIASAIQTANATAQSMMVASGASLLSTVTSTGVSSLTSQYMSAIAGSITQQLGALDPTALANATSGPPANLAQALANMGANPATMAATAASTAGQVSNLSHPSALSSYPALGDQVIGMVLARAGTFGWMASTQLQTWVDAIGTALAVNSASSLNPGSVGFTLGNYFATSQPDLSKAPPTLTLTIVTIGATGGNGALPLCSTLVGGATSPNPGVNCTPNPTGSGGALPLCSALPAGITAITSGSSQNCVSGTGGALPSCLAIASVGTTPTTTICTPDTTSPCSALPTSPINMQYPGLTCTSGTGGTGTLPSCTDLATQGGTPTAQNCIVGTNLPACTGVNPLLFPGFTCTSGTGGTGGTLPLCNALPLGVQPITSGPTQNCRLF